MKNLPDLLKKNSVFATLAPSALNELVQMASSRSYQKGEKVIL
jgi:hypothetical protein